MALFLHRGIIMSKLLIYEVLTEYTEFLSKYDEKVPYEHDNTGKRKYVGVVLTVYDNKYFAPMSSPKPKHETLPSKMLDLYKINDGKYGVINLNNMIPVPDSCVTKVDINNITDEKYKKLLENQSREIKENATTICKKANKLYNLITSNVETKIRERCCDFKKLERKMKKYIAKKEEQTIEQ